MISDFPQYGKSTSFFLTNTKMILMADSKTMVVDPFASIIHTKGYLSAAA